MTTTINPFTGRIYPIAADATGPLVIENFDPTQDAIQLPGNRDSEVIQQFGFSDRYTLTEIPGDTVISGLCGQSLAVIKRDVCLFPVPKPCIGRISFINLYPK